MRSTPRDGREVTVNVKGKNMTVSPALHDVVEKKMQRCVKYLDRLSSLEVELSKENTREAAAQNRVEATGHVLGRTVRVTASNDDMRAAVDEAVDRLYRQLNRHKERIKSHHGSKPGELFSPEPSLIPPDLAPEIDEEQSEPELHVERLAVKPQFEDEAIEELESLGRDFFVFLNAQTEQINVVYRRPDGTYGLIVPVPS